MKINLKILLVALALLAPSHPVAAQTTVPRASARPESLATIVETTVRVGDQQVRYLRAGSGPTTIVLLHGWPQSSHEWRRVMPLLADRYTVIAPDLRGVGGTSAPSDNFEKTTMARDVHGLITQLGVSRVVMVGHDIGGMVAYAYARLYPREIIGVAVLDVPLPGIQPWDVARNSSQAWHFDFHSQDPLAERLVAGRQAEYFRYSIDRVSIRDTAISDEDIAIYASAYRSPESLTAGFEWYRAFPADERFNASRGERLDVPVLLVGGDGSMGSSLVQIEQGLRTLGVRDIRRAVIADSGHHVAEENPQATANVIATFAAALQ